MDLLKNDAADLFSPLQLLARTLPPQHFSLAAHDVRPFLSFTPTHSSAHISFSVTFSSHPYRLLFFPPEKKLHCLNLRQTSLYHYFQ
jgi:hypothetical protein